MSVGRDVRTFMQSCHLPVDLPMDTDDRPVIEKFLVRFADGVDDLEAAVSYLDRTETAQTAADLIYILAGLLETFGLSADEVLTVIHRSNLSRIGDDGEPYEVDDNGKVGRGPDYYDPHEEISEIVG